MRQLCKVLSATLADLLSSPVSSYCGDVASGGPPPDLGIIVSVGCDTGLEGCGFGSASEAIISEPADEDEPVTFCNLAETCGDGTCAEFCEDSANCSADCAVWVVPEAVCGDGILAAEEQCEEDSHCSTGFFCGDPGTNAPCVCVPTCGDGLCASYESATTCATDCGPVCGDGAVTHGEQCDGGGCGAGFSCSASCTCDAIPQPGGGGAVCGDGKCNGGEDGVSCSIDCGPI